MKKQEIKLKPLASSLNCLFQKTIFIDFDENKVKKQKHKGVLMLRCVNAETLCYTDIVCPIGTSRETKIFILKNADIINGVGKDKSWEIHEEVKFDYGFFIQLLKNGKVIPVFNGDVHGFDRNGDFVVVNLETNELLNTLPYQQAINDWKAIFTKKK